MKREGEGYGNGALNSAARTGPRAGLAGWLLDRLRMAKRARPRLALVERITLAPRQSLALVEAEGKRFLVATSAEGAAAFYALDSRQAAAHAGRTGLDRSGKGRAGLDRHTPDRQARISW